MGQYHLAVAAFHTTLLLRLRWRLTRTWTSRITAVIVVALIGGALTAAARVGSIVSDTAVSSYGTITGDFAATYLVSISRGELGPAGATVLAVAIIISLVAPFTGTANLSLISQQDLLIVRPIPLHRWFTAWLLNAFSTIGLLQLLLLTSLTSSATALTEQAPGMVITWLTWMLLVTFTTANGWIVDYVHRYYGKQGRAVTAAVAAAIAAATAVMVLVGRTATFTGNGYVTVITKSANTSEVFIAAVCVILSITIGVAGLGVWSCRAALAGPPVTQRTARARTVRPLPSTPAAALRRIIIRQVIRTSEIRRPIITIALIAAPVAIVIPDRTSAVLTLVVAAPLAVTLSFTVNAFGVLGSAMPWLVTQPNVISALPRAIAVVHISVIAGISLVTFTVPMVMTTVDSSTVAATAAGLTIALALTTRYAMHRSVSQPYRVHFTGQGESIAPPAVTVRYTVTLLFMLGIAGMIVVAMSSWVMQVILVGLVVLWVAMRWRLTVHTVWRNPQHRAELVAAVSAE